ncbi:glucose 1-dehydrogenase [Terrarubrum flagellatum]|uniref:glucose 1-dehydrogenase n=1 Tax=Terrirubrum flagellatum TaxID=2895980 RepID=UPI00314508F9
MGRVAGKAAIVTGAGQGMGEASARLLAREGARVVVADLNEATGEKVAASIRESGGDAIFARLDVVDENGWRHVIGETKRAFGGLHVVVNNAGVAFPAGSVEALSLDEWRQMLSINLESVFLGVKYGIELMRETGDGGSIINFSSILGLVANPAQAAYGASKGGVRLLTKSAALHCAQAGYRIRVNSIHPGYIWTPMLEETLRRRGDFEEHKRIVEGKTPLGHCGEADDVAYGVLYLASNESRFVTGTELVIDGGYTAQ